MDLNCFFNAWKPPAIREVFLAGCPYLSTAAYPPDRPPLSPANTNLQIPSRFNFPQSLFHEVAIGFPSWPSCSLNPLVRKVSRIKPACWPNGGCVECCACREWREDRDTRRLWAVFRADWGMGMRKGVLVTPFIVYSLKQGSPWLARQSFTILTIPSGVSSPGFSG